MFRRPSAYEEEWDSEFRCQSWLPPDAFAIHRDPRLSLRKDDGLAATRMVDTVPLRHPPMTTSHCIETPPLAVAGSIPPDVAASRSGTLLAMSPAARCTLPYRDNTFLTGHDRAKCASCVPSLRYSS